MKKIPSHSAQKTAHAPHEVRIIGGQWKRTPLPVRDLPGLRPTPSRIRETLFNWLGQDLTGLRCIDAFAGTGALGLEAASRAAAEVLLVEQDAGQVRSLGALVTRLKAQNVLIERGDGVAALRQRRGQSWDLVFLDPPFDAGNNETQVQAALEAARDAMHAGGEIYLESPQPWTDAMLEPLGLVLHRRGKAGAVAFQLLRLSTPV